MARRDLAALAILLSAIQADAEPIPVPFDPSGGRWSAVVARMSVEEPVLLRCLDEPAHCPTPAVRIWRDEVAIPAAVRSGLDRLVFVNAAINRGVPYRSDPDRHGRADHWATPLETLSRGGDCEDIAILKLWTLKLTGTPAGALRLLVGPVAAGNQGGKTGHAALLADLDGGPHLLDNRKDQPFAAHDIQGAFTVGLDGAEVFAEVFQIRQRLQRNEARAGSGRRG